MEGSALATDSMDEACMPWGVYITASASAEDEVEEPMNMPTAAWKYRGLMLGVMIRDMPSQGGRGEMLE